MQTAGSGLNGRSENESDFLSKLIFEAIAHGDNLAGPVDTFLKASIAASVLIVSASIAYYYLHYLPQRDAQIDSDRMLERARVEYSRQAEQVRLSAEKRANEEKQTADREAQQARYEFCVHAAETNYSRQWADQCKRISDKAQKQRADCISKATDKASCDMIYPPGDASPNCSLPRVLGTDIDDQLQKSRERCLQESRLGLQ